MSSLNPRTRSYEFFGPPGAFAVTVGTPSMSYALFYACNEAAGGCPPPLDSLLPSFLNAVSDPSWWAGLWDPYAFKLYGAWYLFCLVAWAVLPGDWVQGTQLRNGQYQKYKINGPSCFSYRSRVNRTHLTVQPLLPILLPWALPPPSSFDTVTNPSLCFTITGLAS